MTSYTFTVIPATSGNSYRDIQYFNPDLYYVSYTAPYIRKLTTTGTVIGISSDSLLFLIDCLAVVNSTTFYCGSGAGEIYKVESSVATLIITDPDNDPITSMTLKDDNTILYITTPNKIYTMNTVGTATLTQFTTTPTTTFTNLNSIRLNSSTLFVTDYTAQKLYKINSSTQFIYETITTTINPGGGAHDQNSNWYVTNQSTSSGISFVSNDGVGTVTDIATDLPASIHYRRIAFDTTTDFAYYLIWNTNGIFKSSPAFCFNKGTKILCMNNQFKDEYVAIELLQIGDFVKTYKHGYRKVSRVINGTLKNNPKKWNMCMYKMVKTPTNGLKEDLIVTGGHSLLVDEITDAEQKRYDEMGISEFSKLTIDNKHLLLSCCSDQFSPMQNNEIYTYYHLLLENNDDVEERFGIWANGILTETPNVKTVN
jgi:hypothetical protein